MNVRRVTLAPLLCLILTFPAFGSDIQGILERFDRSVEQEMARTEAPGVAAVIVRNGRVLHERAFGSESVETNRPVTVDSLFRLGSTTKMFVALAALRMEAEGIVTFDEPIATWAPALDPAIGRLTLHQLLSHTSGLRDDAPMRGPLEDQALSDRVESWTAEELFTIPGEIFSYSNQGYVLASYVMEKASGRHFPDLMRERILEPLGMDSATFRPLVAMTHPIAQPHQRSRDGVSVIRPFPENAANHAPGSLFASTADLRHFLLTMTSEQTAPELARLTGATSTIPATSGEYGYGLQIETIGEERALTHSGARLGYGSFIMIVPEHAIALAIVGNTTGAIFDDSAEQAVRELLEIEEPTRPAALEYVEMTPEEMASLKGDYRNSENIRTRVVVDGGELTVLTPRGPVVAHKTIDGSFHAPGAGPLSSFRFVTGADGREYLVAEMWATRKIEPTEE